MLLRFLVVLVLPFLLFACPKPFQPVAPAYELWSKPGASELEVKKALLECGSPSTDPVLNTYKYAFGIDVNDSDVFLNKFFLQNACMEKSGFIPRKYTVEQYCSWERHKNLPVCQPGAKIPEPSIDRRLNSWYCKLKTDYQFCLENAPNPAACNLEGHRNPPSECLP